MPIVVGIGGATLQAINVLAALIESARGTNRKVVMSSSRRKQIKRQEIKYTVVQHKNYSARLARRSREHVLMWRNLSMAHAQAVVALLKG